MASLLPRPVLVTAGVAGLVLVGVAVWVLGPGAMWVLHHIDGVYGLTGKEKASALDAIRGRVITIITGILALVAVYYTATNAHTARRAQQHSEEIARRSEEATRRSHDFAVEAAARSHELASETARRAAELTEQGQVTDRYTKAIGQLGDDKLDIRLGGIYALERIARDSARDHPIKVLAAFLCERSQDDDANAPATETASKRDPDAVGRLRPDLQAALTVIARRNVDRDDIDAVDLTGARLRRADLSGAYLYGAILIRADLSGASLSGAHLETAFLIEAVLAGAYLRRAGLSVANLTRADLTRADLTEASLSGADLSGADLSETRNANLTGTKGTPRVPPPVPPVS